MTTKYTFTISASVSEVYEALSTLGGLRSWWSSAIDGTPEKGGILSVGVGLGKKYTFEVTDTKQNKWIVWTILSTPAKTKTAKSKFSLRLLEDDNRTTNAIFEYEKRKDLDALYTKEWREALESLKQLCETGKGAPKTPKKAKVKK